MCVGGLGLHIGQVDDGAIVGDKGCSQRQDGVLHPKTLLTGLLKGKQHAFGLGHFCAVHQTNGPLIGVGGHLRLDLVHARLQLNAGQLQLWRTLRPSQRTKPNAQPGPLEMIHKSPLFIRE